MSAVAVTVNRAAVVSPTISSISPNSVTSPVSGTLTLYGANFQSGFGATVNFPSGPVPLSSGALTFISSSQVRAAVYFGDPAGGQNSYNAIGRATSRERG